MRTTVEMAREAGWDDHHAEFDTRLKRFAELVRADERARMAEQPAQQEPVAYGMWDTMLGKGNRMMMVRLDKGQDGCTVPLYTSPQPAQQRSISDMKFGGCPFCGSQSCVAGQCQRPARTALEQKLAEQIKRELVGEQPAQQEPVAKDNSNYRLDPPGLDQLYTSPPAQRKPLTLTEVDDAYFARKDGTSLYGCFLLGVRFAEAAHGIKENT